MIEGSRGPSKGGDSKVRMLTVLGFAVIDLIMELLIIILVLAKILQLKSSSVILRVTVRFTEVRFAERTFHRKFGQSYRNAG